MTEHEDAQLRGGRSSRSLPILLHEGVRGWRSAIPDHGAVLCAQRDGHAPWHSFVVRWPRLTPCFAGATQSSCSQTRLWPFLFWLGHSFLAVHGAIYAWCLTSSYVAPSDLSVSLAQHTASMTPACGMSIASAVNATSAYGIQNIRLRGLHKRFNRAYYFCCVGSTKCVSFIVYT